MATALSPEEKEAKAAYNKAYRAAGLNVHVDHIVPLKARLASGLHVHQNLTIKLAGWNDSKSNKYDPMGAAP